jgi:hypothetical protein
LCPILTEGGHKIGHSRMGRKYDYDRAILFPIQTV